MLQAKPTAWTAALLSTVLLAISSLPAYAQGPQPPARMELSVARIRAAAIKLGYKWDDEIPSATGGRAASAYFGDDLFKEPIMLVTLGGRVQNLSIELTVDPKLPIEDPTNQLGRFEQFAKAMFPAWTKANGYWLKPALAEGLRLLAAEEQVSLALEGPAVMVTIFDGVGPSLILGFHDVPALKKRIQAQATAKASGQPAPQSLISQPAAATAPTAAPPAAQPTQAPPPQPAPAPATSTGGGVAPLDANTCPPSHSIKGNINSKGERIYHTTSSRSYSRTKPETCFATEADAVAEGFRAPLR